MKKIVAISLSCILSASLLLTGCGASKAASAGTTLRTVSMFGEGDSGSEAYQSLIASYMQQYGGVTIEDRSAVSSEEWKQGVMDSFETVETTPDVLFYFNGADVRRMILNNQLVSIEEIQEVYPDYGTNIRSSTMEFMREFDGNHYAVPVKGFWEGLFCNQDLFRRYDLPLPTDWESFLKAIEVFSADGIVPVAVSLKEVPHYWIEHLILSQGGATQHRLNPKNYVPETWVKGIEQFKTLYELSAFPAETTTMSNADATALFMEKKAAMILDGSWFVQSITDPENTVVLPFPVVPDGKMQPGDIISGYSSGYYITRNAWDDPAKREAAVNFVKHMTKADSIAAMCAQGGAPAMDIAQSGDSNPLQESANLLQQNAKNACMPIDSKLYKDAWQYLCGAIADVAKGTVSPQTAIFEVSQRNQW